MQKSLITLFTIIVVFHSHFAVAQVEFVPGYFIDENGQKITCQIKDLGKEEIPSTLIIRRQVSSETEKIKTERLQEFQIGNRQYVKFMIDVDRNATDLTFISENRKADLKADTIFLQSLILGEASLYRFYEGDQRIFFLQKKGAQPFQLIRKYYKIVGKDTYENNEYRQQLRNNLPCSAITMGELEKLKYKTNDMVRLVKKYNTCVSSTIEEFKTPIGRWKIQGAAKVGIRIAELDFLSGEIFPTETTLQGGFEIEAFLPVKKEKWSFFLNPTYNNYQIALDGQFADYRSIVFSLGVRHHFYLNDDVDLFINAATNQQVFISNDATIRRNSFTLEGQSFNLAAGGGIKWKDRFILEYRIGNL